MLVRVRTCVSMLVCALHARVHQLEERFAELPFGHGAHGRVAAGVHAPILLHDGQALVLVEVRNERLRYLHHQLAVTDERHGEGQYILGG